MQWYSSAALTPLVSSVFNNDLKRENPEDLTSLQAEPTDPIDGQIK